MKEPNRTVYIRKASQNTLRELSEKTRLSQSEILAQWLDAIQLVMSRFSDMPYERLTLASYPTERKEVKTLLAPIISGEFNIELSSSEKINEEITDCEIIKDIARKHSKISKVTQK